MKQLLTILSLLFIISCSSYRAGQKKAITQQDIENCNYLENYKWLKETFEKNDAGFEWGIQEKGMDAYKKHCAKIEERIKNAKDVYECRQILNDWGYFFRKGHFVVQLNYFPKVEQVDSPIKTETVAYSLATIKEQQQKYKDPFSISFNTKSIHLYFGMVSLIITSGFTPTPSMRSDLGRNVLDIAYATSKHPSGDVAKTTFETSNEPNVRSPYILTFLLCFADNKNCSPELTQPLSTRIITVLGLGKISSSFSI